MIAEPVHTRHSSIAEDQTFIKNATWLRAEVPVASEVRTSVRLGSAEGQHKFASGDGVVFVPAHRTQKENISLEQGDYELLFEDGCAARATVTRSYMQGGFLVAFFTLALAH